MNWIEIMGPAGIGKTTFLDGQKKFRKSEKEWITASEAEKEIVGNHLDKKGIQRFLQIYLNQRLIKYKIPAIIKYLNTPNRDHLQLLPNYEGLAHSYLEWYLNHFNGPATEKMRRISIYQDLIANLCLFDYYIPQRIVVLDEGPLNLHPNINKQAISPPFCPPKLIVFCHLDIKDNLERIRLREKQGRLAVSHRGLNDKEMEALISHNHERFLQHRNFLIGQDFKFIDVDLTNMITKPII